MNRYEIHVLARARREYAAALAWWRLKRLAAPHMLRDEMRAAKKLLSEFPEAGELDATEQGETRRLPARGRACRSRRSAATARRWWSPAIPRTRPSCRPARSTRCASSSPPIRRSPARPPRGPCCRDRPAWTSRTGLEIPIEGFFRATGRAVNFGLEVRAGRVVVTLDGATMADCAAPAAQRGHVGVGLLDAGELGIAALAVSR